MTVLPRAEMFRPERADEVGFPQTGATISRTARNPARDAAVRQRRALSARAWWHRRTLRTQLLILFVVIDVIAALIAGGVTILQARTSTRVEMAASIRLAEVLVIEAVQAIRNDPPSERLLENLPLQLRFLRHVRISVSDPSGAPVLTRPIGGDMPRGHERAPAPGWFAALIAPAAERREVPITVDGRRIGSAFITGEPADEVAEVWENTAALGATALALNAVMIAILYVLFGRVLRPLARLAGGLVDLERRHYAVRLARPAPDELAGITDRFNALAQALDAARIENARLTHRLISAQDDERRQVALELHDEVGPCLFGLRANAGSVQTAVGGLPDAAARLVEARAGEMVSIIARLQAINRNLLNRLRPMALGHVPLRELLSGLARDRLCDHPGVAIALSVGALRASYGDPADLTIYRGVQEGITNAVRHADPRTITIEIGEDAGPASGRHVSVVIRDDGRGIDPAAPRGFGLTGMHQRVHALGGECRVERCPDGGTSVRIVIPISADAASAPEATAGLPA
jgi:two-component system sensor histidine kinase UhpB